MKDRVAKSIFWIFWSRGVIQVLSFATTIVVAHWLDPSDYGLMALAGTFIGVLGLICELGLGAAVVQFGDLEKRELNLCFDLAFGTACAVYAILYLAAPTIADWFSSPRLASVLRVSALVLPIGALAIVPFGLIQRRLELQHVTKADMSAGLVALAVVFLLAWRGAGVWSLVASSLARTAVRAALLYYYSPWLPGLRAGSARTRNILSFSVGTFSSRAVWSIYDQSDNFILGKVAGEYALGFYTMARDIASIPVTRISSAVNQLSVPLMATLQQAPAAMRNMLLRGLRLTASVSIPACVGIALVADDLVQVALSDKWRSIVPILRVLCGIALIKSLDVLIAPVLRARYRTTYLATYNVVLLVIMPLSFLVGARLAGSIGVAWAWLVAYPIVMSRMATTAFREIDLSWRVALAQLRTPALAALLMTPVVLAVRALIVGDEWRIAFARLLASSCIGAVAYIASIWFMGGPLKGEMLEIASWLFRPAQRDVK